MTLVSTASKAATPFNGGTITQPLLVNAATATGAKLLRAVSPDMEFYVDDTNTVTYFGTQAPSLTVQDNAGNGARIIALDNQSFRQATLKSGAVAGDGMLILNDGNFNRVVLGDTLFLFRINAAPADAALAANQCSLWFDSTNGVGATKLMVKGKSADGTVKTAAIVLA